MNSQEISRYMESRKVQSGEAISVVTVCLDQDSLTQLNALIESVRIVSLRATLSHYSDGQRDSILTDFLRGAHPDICVIDFDSDREKAAATAAAIHEALEDVVIFAASENAQPDLIIRAMRCGCSEYLVKPLVGDDLLEAVARVAARKKGKPAEKLGKVVTLMGAKGGSGVTTLGIYLASILKSSFGQNTLLVDYHPDLGDAALYLSLEKYQYHFYDLVRNTHRLDSELLDGFLLQHTSGLEVLPAPESFSETQHQVSPQDVNLTLDFLRTQYGFVIVDCPPGLNETNLLPVQRSDEVYLVATPEVPAVRNLARYLEQLGRLGVLPERIHVVINRDSKRNSVTADQIEKAIRKPISWKIPNQYAEVVKAINLGEAGTGRGDSEFIRSITAWAERLAGVRNVKSRTKKKGFLGLG